MKQVNGEYMRLGCVAVSLALLLAHTNARADSGTPNGFKVIVEEPRFGSFSASECNDSPSPEALFQWSTSTLPAVDESEEVFIGAAADCSMNLLEVVPPRPRLNSQTSFPATPTESLTARNLFDAVTNAVGALNTAPCGGPMGLETDVFICVRIARPDLMQPALATAPVHLDSAPPTPPTDVQATALDGAASVTWAAPNPLAGTARFKVYVTPPTGEEIVSTVEGTATLSTVVVGLTNGTTYRVAVTAIDNAGVNGNESARAEPVDVTPQPAEDFWQRYRRLGGHGSSGCASTDAPMWALALVVLAVVRRRRVLLGVGVAGALLSSPARAEWNMPEKASTLRVTLQFRGAFFKPDIDSESGLTGQPYADIFGINRRFMGGLQVGVGAATSAGIFALELGANDWSAEGNLRQPANNDVTTAQKVSLNLVPLSVALVWRWQFVHERWGIPLVPFGRVGYGFVSWSTRRENPTGDSVSGWARGLEAGGGLQLTLDGIDKRAADRLWKNYHIVSTGLFVDYTVTRWQGAGGLDLGGSMVGFGFNVMF